MKNNIALLGTLITGAALLTTGCAPKNSVWKSIKNPQTTAQLKSFVAEKSAQAIAAAKTAGQPMPPEFKSFFAAAAQGDWPGVHNRFREFSRHAPQYELSGRTDMRLRGTEWGAVMETFGLLECLNGAGEKYSAAYGDDIIDSIPAGSIYFGGTDPGRFLVTGFEKSQVNADPFFVLTQNALADESYLQYLRSMYADKIYVPTAEDSQNCFHDYAADAQVRAQNHQLKPGENVKTTDGRLQISGLVSVMEINGLLAKVLFDKNPDRDFYLQESYPLDWMYPHLAPHGLIFKINRQPLAELSVETCQQDHDYWTHYVQPLIGDWLSDDTSVETVGAFVKKVFRQHDLTGFTGDPHFVQNQEACKMFSQLRGSLAHLYVWRLDQARTPAEQDRMARAADFAFRQALALWPNDLALTRRYVAFLNQQNRSSDAKWVGEMTIPQS